ncbi:MAG: hypothetical protein V1706_03455 [Pseudomonadota bacterium]
MKKKLFLSLLLIAITVPNIAFGVTKSITIAWSSANISSATGYKMYYSYNTDMEGKTIACETNNPAATSLTCDTVNIEAYPVFFTIGASTALGEIESSPKSYGTPISIVTNFTLATATVAPNLPSYSINFQPSASPVPTGYIVDSGDSYNDTRGYGWIQQSLDGTRDRDNPASPDNAYDTNIRVLPDAIWEIKVPNGTYSITVCAGDPSYPSEIQAIQAENLAIINREALSSTVLWIERSSKVTVNDERLTLTFTGSALMSKLCWLKILPAAI